MNSFHYKITQSPGHLKNKGDIEYVEGFQTKGHVVHSHDHCDPVLYELTDNGKGGCVFCDHMFHGRSYGRSVLSYFL